MKKLILFSAIVLLSIQTISEAQQNVTSCIGRKVNVYTKIDVPPIYKERSLLQKTASIFIQVVESTENPLPSAARQALDKAVDIWSYLIDSEQDITIYAEWTDKGWDEENNQGILASCGPSSFAKNFTGAPVQNKQYPIALAEAVSNSNLNETSYEITLSINSNSNIDWYTGTDGIPQENKFDLVSVLLHEIAHGLGYLDSFDNRNGLGSYGEPSEILEGYPTIYDQYCVVGSTHPSNDRLINYTQSSEVLAEKLTSENIYFDGHNTYLSNNNSSAKLYAPAVWTPGSSIAHLDDDVFPASNRNSLMTHASNMAEVVHSPGEVGLSVLEDIGWSVNRLMIMIYPNEETTLTKGSTINIVWAENNSGSVDLVLYRVVSGIPLYETTINTGSVYSNRGENNYSWTIPSSPTEVPVGQYRIKLEYVGEGLSVSEIFNISDQLQVATPDITPKSGTYTTTQSVTITCSTENAQIYYTTNGSEPTTSSTLYNGVPFNATPPVTIKAKAFKSGYIASETAVEVYDEEPDGVTISQVDKNGNSFGKVAIWHIHNYWNYFNSGEITLRYSTMTLKALQEYKPSTTEKFNFWIDNFSNKTFRNWESISTSSGTNEIKARFFDTYNVTIQNALEGFTSFNDGTISFKDPWKKDDFSDQNKGVRNRGSNALMNSYNSPLSIATSGEFMGVLKDQEIEDGTYYSVQALSTQQISGINTYFVNWTTTGADIPSPNSLVTPIVFRQANAVVKANYKGTHLSGNPSAFSNNSQNKFIKADGAMYQVYESMGRIWMERSTNNGSSWEILNNAQPIDVYNGRYPSLAHFDSGNQSVVVVYLDDAYGYQVRVKVFQNGSPAFEGVAADEVEHLLTVSSDSQPVAAYNYNGRLMVVWNHGGYLYYRYGQIVFSESTIYWYNSAPAVVTGSGTNSTRPTIAKDSGLDFYLAWQEGYSSIKYCKLQRDGSDNINIVDAATISTGSGYPDNYYPNITILSSGYPKVTWIGSPYYGSTSTKVISRSKTSGGWNSTFGQYGLNVNSPVINTAGTYDIIAWTENQGSTNKLLKYGSIKSFNTTGKDIQLCSGSDLYSMYGSAFQTSTAPYSFATTNNVGSIAKEGGIVMNCGRAGIMTSANVEYYFIIGDVTVDGNPVQFVEIPKGLILKGLEEMNNYLFTEPFTINDNSGFEFGLVYGVTDSTASIDKLKEGESVGFDIELIDESTKEAIGNYDSFEFKKNSVLKEKSKVFKIKTDGIGNKTVRLRIKARTNVEGIFTLAEILNDNNVLPKSGREPEKVSYAGSLEIKDYDLVQNYPNPFNPSTTITYQLPTDGFVTLKIFDVLGKEIATLVEDVKSKGRYNVVFDASKLSSGIYIYTLDVNGTTGKNFRSSKKMLMIK